MRGAERGYMGHLLEDGAQGKGCPATSITATVADNLASRYFNTVGSKEGWTPSNFVSSRTNRRKDQPGMIQQRPEDFMDEEDLRDAEEARKIETSAAFAGLGSTEKTVSRADALMGLFRVQGDTMGTKLLRKMGWKDGQGIGPKVRRTARLDAKKAGEQKADTFLFAPENVPMISFERKQDKKGLGYQGEPGLRLLGPSNKITSAPASEDEEEDRIGNLGRPRLRALGSAKKPGSTSRGGIGTGILNDTGSDDEDPYEIGPRISYNRVIGGDKKKKKAITAANPAVKKPAFLPNRSALKRVGLAIRRCHDGRLPLEGFVFGQEPDSLTTEINADGKYPPPEIPPDWKSSKQPRAAPGQPDSYLSTADAAKASSLDPKGRAALLGEKQLPGKSVFDFLSSSARDRLAAVTGKTNLPEAKGEIPAGYNLSEEERRQQLLNSIPKLEKETAIAAIARGASGPYADNEEKRARYRAYLEFAAGYRQALPLKPNGMKDDDWLQEFHEFYNCARIFKPMTGLMASRFTTSTSTNNLSAGSKKGDERDLVAKPPAKAADPAEEAAKMGMFGDMTRSATDFYPSRLLCKRFGVRPPAHVQPDESEASRSKTATPGFADYGAESRPASRVDAPLTIEYGINEEGTSATPEIVQQTPAPVIDSSRNEALEGQRAGEEVFKAIFGDSDDDED
jgi:G patch domain-containing protein 1